MRILAKTVFLATTLGLVLEGSSAVAQRRSLAQPENMTLTTRDGVGVTVTYFPSSAGADATPVVMLHDLKESRAVYRDFATRLSRPGPEDTHPSFAVVTVDLRGHGDSMTQTLPGSGTRQIEAAKLRKNDTRAMVLGDLEAVRKFLVGENDANKLNLNRLAIIGTGLGAVVGVNYAAYDWSIENLATVKQGRDVKSLLLISPRWKLSGLDLRAALRQPDVRRRVAMLMLYGGKERKFASDAKRIYKQVEKYHPDAATPEQGKLPSLLQFGRETELQGTELLKQEGKRAEDLMIRFLVQYSVEPEYERSKRRSN